MERFVVLLDLEVAKPLMWFNSKSLSRGSVGPQQVREGEFVRF